MDLIIDNDANIINLGQDLFNAGGFQPDTWQPSHSRVLIVDDDPRLLQSLKELLKLHQYNITTADSGSAAIDTIKRQFYDLILLDLNMPEVSGHDVMSFIVDNGIETVVIVVSGETTFDAATRARRQGAHDFLRKPYAPDELLKTISNALSKKHLEKQNLMMQARLVASEKLHRYVVNASPDIIYMLDSRGQFTFLNDKIQALLGYNKEELMTMHYSEVVHPDYLMQAHYVFNERRTGDRAARNIELLLLCKNRDDAPKFFDTHSIPIELNSIGIYAKANDGDSGKFLGTYGVARDITARKQAEDTISFQASHDLLTELPNKALLEDRMQIAVAQAERCNHKLAVLYIDIDRFKRINDTLGHIHGDQLLQRISERLGHCLYKGDTLSRFGGNEFIILLPERDEPESQASTLASEIVAILRKPFDLAGHEITIGANIGIAIYPDHGNNSETLIKHANIAMHQRKITGKTGYCFYHNKMTPPKSNSLTLESALHRAINEDQFILHYQPQVDVISGQIIGVEALIRWQHPTEGLLMPADFISLAEESGLIADMGKWVLKRACQELKQWLNQGLPPIRMSVNISANQLIQDGFVTFVTDTLNATGISAELLEIEITENVLMQDIHTAIQKLNQLSKHGIQIAIDDFGTGYSSLNYLQMLPIHTLKIDGSFTRSIGINPKQSCIVDAIVAMAKGLRLNIIAECVENTTQLDYLRKLGCQQIQGNIYSKPLDSETLVALLKSSPYLRPIMAQQA